MNNKVMNAALQNEKATNCGTLAADVRYIFSMVSSIREKSDPRLIFCPILTCFYQLTFGRYFQVVYTTW